MGIGATKVPDNQGAAMGVIFCSRFRRPALGIGLALISTLPWPAAPAAMQAYRLGPENTRVGFTVRYLAVAKAEGRFPAVEGGVRFDPDSGEVADIDVTIGTASVDTGQPARDARLRGEGFFWTEHYPTMHFKGLKVERTGPGSGIIRGELTLRGVTKPLALDVAITPDQDGAPGQLFITAKGTLDRRDFGMVDGVAGLFIANKVALRIDATGLTPEPASP
jgi:polyisoprenoid-binding protein YceI